MVDLTIEITQIMTIEKKNAFVECICKQVPFYVMEVRPEEGKAAHVALEGTGLTTVRIQLIPHFG